MKRTDYIKLLGAGLLSVPESRFQQLADFIAQRFELEELSKANTLSIGAESSNGSFIGLIDWAKSLRKETFISAVFFHFTPQHPGLEPHVTAAFAGVEDSLLEVTTKEKTRYYLLQTRYSPMNEMTPSQLVELVNAQPGAQAQWQRIEELIQQSNSLNNRPLITEGSAEAYIVSPSAYHTFEWQAGDFVKELQLNALINQQEFVIPEALKELLEQSTFSLSEYASPRRDYTYLYPVTDLSPDELIALIEAQSFADAVIQKTENYAKEYPEGFSFDASTWKGDAHRQTKESLQLLVSMVCRFICECCDEQDAKPNIPQQLKDKLGPDELEAKRIKARGELEDSQWYLKRNTQPWELYLFASIGYNGDKQAANAISLKNDLRKVLQEIELFARKISSNFAEAFWLASYLLSDDVPSGSFDQTHRNKIVALLQARSFPDYGIENFHRAFDYSEELMILNKKTADIYAFMAVSIADVFGGMGSWNDIYMNVPEEQDEYHRLSAKLFDTLRAYFTTLISFTYVR